MIQIDLFSQKEYKYIAFIFGFFVTYSRNYIKIPNFKTNNVQITYINHSTKNKNAP